MGTLLRPTPSHRFRQLSAFLPVVCLVALAARGMAANAPAPDWDARHYGAVGDGQVFDTPAIQAAIDAAHAAGGGRVHVGAGTYLCKTIDLLSGVTLHLDAGATLLGSAHIADYRRGYWPALIKARGQDHIAIEGEGTIDGRGQLVAEDTLCIGKTGRLTEFFPELKPGQPLVTRDRHGRTTTIDPWALQREGKLQGVIFNADNEGNIRRANEFVRPEVLDIWECRDVRIAGVTLRNAACWVETYRDCDDLVISGIKVRSTAYWNNDGIDIVDCRHVRIDHCDVDAADDGICLKSESDDLLCDDVSISDCRLRSSASALKFGTASRGGFRHIRASHLEVYDTYRSAVALETVDGGVLEDVVIDDVRARNTGGGIFLRLGQRASEKAPGTLHHVVLSNFDLELAAGQPDAGYAFPGPPTNRPTNPLPSSIVGLPGHPVEDITLRNIKIVCAGGGKPSVADVPLEALETIPERAKGYPEYSMFGELPAWAFFVRHAAGIHFEHVSIRPKAADFRSAIVASDVAGLAFDSVTVASGFSGPSIVLHGVTRNTEFDLALPPNQGVLAR